MENSFPWTHNISHNHIIFNQIFFRILMWQHLFAHSLSYFRFLKKIFENHKSISLFIWLKLKKQQELE